MEKSELSTLLEFWQSQQEKWDLLDYSLKYDHCKTTYGRIFYKKKLILISSYHLLHSPIEHVQDTILHEIAHAKAGLFAYHGPLWKLWASKVGATPTRCSSYPDVLPDGKFQLICGVCLRILRSAHRRSNLKRKYCLKCGTDSLGELFWIDTAEDQM